MNRARQIRSLTSSQSVAIASLLLAITLVATITTTGWAQSPNYSEAVLYSFTGAPDGAAPEAALVRDAHGNLYGTTVYGGNPSCIVGAGGCGTVFQVDRTGKETVLHTFGGTGDGGLPYAGLLRDPSQGDLYGATFSLGTSGKGIVFKLDASGNETVYHNFTGSGGDGAGPIGGVVGDTQGNHYGTTVNGGNLACYDSQDGDYGCGTVFKVDTTGKLTPLYTFMGAGGDGANPQATLAIDNQGNLYGTTTYGGNNSACSIGGTLGCGTIFKVDSSGNETVLYRFNGAPDGAYPEGGLLRDVQGNLYGTTAGGGASYRGTVFKLDTSGHETILYSFTGAGGDGAYPYYVVLVSDGQGNLYGTTSSGGSANYGTVFELDTNGKETVLHSFTGGNDGQYPYAGVVRDVLGNLYGTTTSGGASNLGTVFKLTRTVPPCVFCTPQ